MPYYYRTSRSMLKRYPKYYLAELPIKIQDLLILQLYLEVSLSLEQLECDILSILKEHNRASLKKQLLLKEIETLGESLSSEFDIAEVIKETEWFLDIVIKIVSRDLGVHLPYNTLQLTDIDTLSMTIMEAKDV